ncbi:stromal membrane-associated protein 1-like [Boleophthalmus pectinirostris]|uniref:stromal membrane-associated protein 1-like n=1 Tax=Boleophthalmus pectinirostris TaxID=150288 RepID=UPI002432BC80|nr:stromal membrane-associated protein 1-like [Boleophthalmus pectinirostris]
MTTRSEREKAQKLNEQHQAILSKLLREEENKYCADCEAKGPRWASWNLGVFMCIRCAGIHRNLGVHISRVKSVNLDQWTPEQIQSMVEMGNSRAKQVYEAHLPESFRRPQSDQAVEVFIRDKYERKRYFDKDALPPKSEVTASPSSQEKNKPEKEKKKEEKKREKETERNNSKSESRSPKKSPEPNVDLLGLDGPDSSSGRGSSPAEPISNEVDLFGPMVSNPLPSSGSQSAQAGGGTAPPTSPAPVSSSSSSAAPRPEEKKLMSKDSILSLYSSQPQGAPPQQNATGQGFLWEND